jgi:hypothetical protein
MEQTWRHIDVYADVILYFLTFILPWWFYINNDVVYKELSFKFCYFVMLY